MIYLYNDTSFISSCNNIICKVSFISPGRNEDNFIQTSYKKSLYSILHGRIEDTARQAARTLNIFDDYIPIVLIINDYASDECEKDISIYADYKYKDILEKLIVDLPKAVPEEEAILRNGKLRYCLESEHDLTESMLTEKDKTIRHLRDDVDYYKSLYEDLKSQVLGFVGDISKLENSAKLSREMSQNRENLIFKDTNE